ncbi:uncharacterized protein B0H18DRAFT_880398 [Fomitopsis serialis]|uniref:uncharacterized protein n=1 Tax=Fomitopsis serialis TaxID=139415 RepID=UPI0020088620|nr:uncharacterized protein B0H18DRAFT_880398 [Neoantrodia serialis]KAH9921126.1 hypothetical protein B0H18DRAFT_880398 [Neoantrodia serialis]
MATTVVIVGLAAAAAYVGLAAGWLRLPAYTDAGSSGASAGYVLECMVTHRRLFPKVSSHSFAYRTLWLFVSLNDLESHSLDLGRGWVFGYGGIFGRLIGLRSSAYLHNSLSKTRHIREKLSELLDSEGYSQCGIGNAWMLTMPSFIGYEGINPLTLYYCYDTEAHLFSIVLEVHNTFGERHAYILDTKKGEKLVSSAEEPRLRWNISRDFHVSPFNDRLGDYIITLSEPSHPPPDISGEDIRNAPYPLPYVSIYVSSPSQPSDSPKMTATLRATESKPLTAPNLLHYLARQPFALLSSLLRILYEAWTLHYVKRLDVYGRPDPKPIGEAWGGHEPVAAEGAATPLKSSRGIGWQSATWFEQYTRSRLEDFLQRRAEDIGIFITLVTGNPDEPDIVFAPKTTLPAIPKEENLTIWYLSPLFFSTLFVAPSIEHALLLGYHTERIFIPSSETLFYAVFRSGATRGLSLAKDMANGPSIVQRIRSYMLPKELLADVPAPPTHPLDPPSAAPLRWLQNLVYITTFFIQSFVEKWLYRTTRARFVPGQEPWLRWDRALEARTGKAPGTS